MGQIKAIDKMIDEDVPCEDVLIQINVAKSALHKVGQGILEGHIKHCVREGIEQNDVEKTISSFLKQLIFFQGCCKVNIITTPWENINTERIISVAEQDVSVSLESELKEKRKAVLKKTLHY